MLFRSNYAGALSNTGRDAAMAVAAAYYSTSNNHMNNTVNAARDYTNTSVTSANNYANATFSTVVNTEAAFAKANGALQNSSATLDGTLTVNNTIVVNTLKGPFTDDTNASSNGSVALKELYYDASGVVRIRLV